jgi:hypothetical protein
VDAVKITLVGSTRFAALFASHMEKLSLAGHTVYGLGFTSSMKEGGEGSGPSPDQKILLDLVHLKKILDSDAVLLVTDESLYFGESTRRELAWAAMLDRQIFFRVEDVSNESSLITPDLLREGLARAQAQVDALVGAVTGRPPRVN